MLERHIESKGLKISKGLGLLYYKFTSPNKRSVPDRLVIGKGRCPTCNTAPTIFIEVKATGKKASRLQALEHTKMEKNGAVVYVIDNITEMQQVLEEFATSSSFLGAEDLI